jgi:uncharacterized membrane protein YhaH (DUF805 family)
MNANHDGTAIAGILYLVPILVLYIWMSFRVFRKAGRNGWWSILLLVPVLNIVVVWVFAFVRWPVLEAPKTDDPSVFD